TIDPAYSVNREFELGSLQTGKLADVIILDRDLFQVSPEEIRDTKVMTTVFDGKIIYQKDK
ncbi:MAG: amidohydrolase, partial [Spirochaetia bacterium]|nr:amidohydrolase [Spirochaetia bacterium]